VLGAELVAIGLTVTAGRAPDAAVARKEWILSFLIALVPNGLFGLMLVVQFLSVAATNR
jgi:hypothetical protein